jgi:hypothetical protein
MPTTLWVVLSLVMAYRVGDRMRGAVSPSRARRPGKRP